MEFTITINTDNAAFDENAGADEIARILETLAAQIRHAGETGHSNPLLINKHLYDHNGNRCGMVHESPENALMFTQKN